MIRDGNNHKPNQEANAHRSNNNNNDIKKETKSNNAPLGNLSGNIITQLQRTIGNKMVGQLLGNNNVIQAKRLYSEVPHNKQGTDSRVQELTPRVHATVFPDSPDFAGPLKYNYISPRWVSSFHITEDEGRNRAYYTDEGVLIDTPLNRGDERRLSGYADQYQDMLDGIEHYSEIKAANEDVVLQNQENAARIAAAAEEEVRKKRRNATTNNIIIDLVKDSGRYDLSAEEIAAKWFPFFRANKAKDGRLDVDQDMFANRYARFQEKLKGLKSKREAPVNESENDNKDDEENTKKRKVDDEKEEEKKK
ncbi:hypothetical protein ACYEXS_29495 [Paenibacillus sp. MAH-36]|uniref:Uncharacterized protein n=1 Tax=Paenibacillus violae TaxID=3077234 RepID=A0ABU3R8G7_9BACL|nr:hypothetical protein [Paenibacillus sp. PFR10]MDU0200558.1 hypothetical protein [Paenibacillus sp. PFR10]